LAKTNSIENVVLKHPDCFGLQCVEALGEGVTKSNGNCEKKNTSGHYIGIGIRDKPPHNL